uniref:Transthyretin-like family protein n=1 Tax=Globodera pallida TaxID=36090 RepID=A0A183BZU9_GLOPA
MNGRVIRGRGGQPKRPLNIMSRLLPRPVNVVVLLVLLGLVVRFSTVKLWGSIPRERAWGKLIGTEESISTRSTRAEGTLMCGKLGASKVFVRLFKTNSDEISNALATAVTNDQGKFIIEGNTANYQGSEANIDPFLKIYHKCDDKKGKVKYVTIGRVPRRNYNIGNLNLVLQYPNEARIDELKGI